MMLNDEESVTVINSDKMFGRIALNCICQVVHVCDKMCKIINQ